MRLINYIIAFLLLVSCAATGGSKMTKGAGKAGGDKKKSWVSKRPINHLYYIGISFAEKTGEGDYHKIAQQQALKDLASQIKISIASKEIHQMIEKNNQISDSYESYLQAAVQAELEGYELMDTWENKNQYWMYFRLSKEKHAAIRRKNIEKAMTLAIDNYKKGNAEQANFQPANAAKSYFQAIKAVEKYANEPLETTIKGKKVFLLNEIISSLQTSVKSIFLQPQQKELKIKQGVSSYPPINVNALTNDNAGNQHPVAYLPVVLNSNSGTEFLSNTLQTDEKGVASGNFKTLNSTAAEQLIFPEIDLVKLSNSDDPTPLIQGIINNLPSIKTQITVYLKGLTAYIFGTELNLGQKMTVNHVVPAIKNSLKDRGFTFTPSTEGSDWIIEVKASTVKGAEVFGMFTAFADVDVSVKLTKTGNEIFRKALHHQKGIQLNYEKAGLKALEDTGEKAADQIVQEIIDLVEKK